MQRVAPLAVAQDGASRKSYGEGRVSYIPAVAFDGPLPAFGSFFPVDARFWRAPRNAAEIVESVRWAARGRMPVEVSGPDWLVANLVEQPEQHRIILHLVNYNARKEPSLGIVRATFQLPDGQSIKNAVLYSPDSDSPQTLVGTGGERPDTLSVPVKAYSVVAVTW